MAKTNIEWTEENYNPFYGCRRKSAGCENCYAEQIAGRFSGIDKNGKVLPYHGIAKKVGGKARWTGEVKLNEKILPAPLTRKTPTTYFVNSMSDTFYSKFPDEWIDRLFAVMALCPQHTFQVLTKRPERMREYLSDFYNTPNLITDGLGEFIYWLGGHPSEGETETQIRKINTWATNRFPNVMLGVSCENQEQADKRIPILLDTPASVRFVSAEPLLGELSIMRTLVNYKLSQPSPTNWSPSAFPVTPPLDWVVIGGESGYNARPCDINWIRSLVTELKHPHSGNIAVFVKQLGSNAIFWEESSAPGIRNFFTGANFKTKNKKGGDISEFPKDLQVREMPK